MLKSCYYLSLEKNTAIHLNKYKLSSPKDALVVPSLIEIGSVVLEKKIFKCCQCIFTISLSCLLFKEHCNCMPFIWTNLNSLNQRMLWAKFGLNWSSGSREEEFLYVDTAISLFHNYLPLEMFNIYIHSL